VPTPASARGTCKCWGAAGEYLGKKYGGNRETTFGGETTGAEAVREVVAELKRKLDPSGEKKREAALNGLDFGRLPDDFRVFDSSFRPSKGI